jgi:MerR family redox-sensitive transcriptional activator SoxR
VKNLTIGELARRSGVSASAIRYYESTGVLPRPDRVHGRRKYDDEAVMMLRAVLAAKAAGFTVKELRTLFRGFADGTALSARWKALAQRKLADLDALIDRAEAMKRVLRSGMRCRCLTLAQCDLIAQA